MIFAAIALALVPFVVIEVCVRSFANSPSAVDTDPVAGLEHLRPLFELDSATMRYQIPDWRLNFFCRESFPAKKAAGTRRIFVLGGSTVQGRPYATETAFSTWLRLRLEAADNGATYEVINCGGVSYASYRVAKILDEVLGYQPDAIVLYTGHNEFLEDRSYAHVRELGPVRRAITRVASYWATVGWIQQQIAPLPTENPSTLSTEVDTRLDHLGGLDSYQPDPTWRREVERQFEQSLAKMIRTTQRTGVPIIVCVPSSDIVNTPPFKTDDTDPHNNAAITYSRGLESWQAGRSSDARRLLVLARDQDVCPLRATSAIVETVRRLSDDFDVPLVDTDAILDNRDSAGNKRPDGIADPESFSDHVHPTIVGHQRIGEAIAKEFSKLGWYVENDQAQQAYEAAVANRIESLDEAYFARGQQRLMGLKRWAAGRAALPIADDEPSY